MNNSYPTFPTSLILKLVGGVITVIVALVLLGGAYANNSADEIMVVQAPFSGNLTFYNTPGMKWQGWGTVTRYKKRDQFWFAKPTENDKTDNSIKIRFNDGGHAQVSGSLAFEMPVDVDHLRQLHTKYGSQKAIEAQLIRTVVEKTIYMTGPLMSSTESYAERRNDLIRFMEDQITNGVYQTKSEEVKENDPVTNEPKTVTKVKLVPEGSGFARQEKSPIADFGIRTYNLSLNSIDYDNTVENQIHQQQEAKMAVQTAVANAKKAEQDAITVQKKGEADAARAKWEQEVIKAKMVTEAQQQVEVAKLQNEAAEQNRQAMIKKGQGEGEYRRLVMAGDGALDKKLAAYVEVQKAYAAAIGEGRVNLVPQIVTGGGNSNGLNLIEVLGLKAAKDLAVDVQAQGQQNTRK